MVGRTGEMGAIAAEPHRGLARARSVAILLDSSIPIPGTKRRIGIDPLLGVIPFVGDFAGTLLSGYIVLSAAQSGAPTLTLIRMVGNVAVDTLVGSIPIIGDLFDAGWKSNVKNVALFEKHVAKDAASGRTLRQVSKLAGVMLVVSSLLAIALLTFVGGLLYFVIAQGLIGG